MAHQLGRDARCRGALEISGRILAALALAALVLLVVVGPRVDELERLGGGSEGTAAAGGVAGLSAAPAHHASPHVLVADVRTGAEQLARPLAGPGPLDLAVTVEILSVALASTALARGRRSIRRRAAGTEVFRRRGPPRAATPSSLSDRAS